MKTAQWMAPLLSASLLVSCQPAQRQAADPTDSTDTPEQKSPALPRAEPPLDREDLLLAVARTASAAGLGQDDRQAQQALDGDRFELRLRFGCPGAGSRPRPGGAFDLRYDAENRTLRLTAAPNVDTDNPLVAALAGEAVEAVEGFLIGRPWLLSTGCPITQPSSATALREEDPAGVAPVAIAAVPRIAIAQFFTKADSRTRRRDQRAYESTTTLAEDERPSAQGYNLVLSGRLKKLPDGRVIACVADGLDAPPDCIISAQFDRVWIERPDTRQIVAEWGSG